MRLGIILVSAAALVVVACSVKSEDNRQSYSYDFTINGCKTGHHEFGSVSELCAGLADETRNHGCAYNSRVEMAKVHGCSQVTGNDFARSWAPKDRYGYEIVDESGCSTGYHDFGNMRDACPFILDDKFNNNCAPKLRTNLYSENRCS
jgi:hypothetical protein